MTSVGSPEVERGRGGGSRERTENARPAVHEGQRRKTAAEARRRGAKNQL